MDRATDLKYEIKAADLLHIGLSGCTWGANGKNEEIDKEKLVSIFKEACFIVNKVGEKSEKYMAAEAVVSSCIRAVRCICLDKEASYTLIQGDVCELNALSQYKNAVRNYEYMK